MRVLNLLVAIVAMFAFVQCTADSGGRGAPASQRASLCVAEWDARWEQGTGANEWWVEYMIEGAPVGAAHLEVPGLGDVTLSYRFDKWVGAASFRIPAGTRVIAHAESAQGKRAQSIPFAYLTETSPSSDPCSSDGGACDDTWTPSFAQGTGANEWWVEYVVSGSVASAYLEVAGGGTVPLVFEYGKWRGAPQTRIPRGTTVVVHAESTTGQVGQTMPFAYLDETRPPAKACDPGGGACSGWDPTWREGSGANEWWVEYVISGAVQSARLEVVGGGSVALAFAYEKWRGAPSARIPAGTSVILHAESTSGELTRTRPFAYLAEKAPTTAPCSGAASYADIGGAETGPDRFAPQHILFDAQADKVLLVGTTSDRPSLRRCNPDGTACTAHILDAGRGPGSGSPASALIDGVAKKLLIVTRDASAVVPGTEARTTSLSLFRCELDGSGCVWSDISAGTGAAGAGAAEMALDPVEDKLLVGTCMAGSGGERRASIVRCGRDGKDCTRTDISPAGSGAACGPASSLVFDDVAQKILFVSRDVSGAEPRLLLTRCEPDATGCAHHFLAAPPLPDYAHVSAVFDRENQKLIAVVSVPGAVGEPLALVRCEADGTGCVQSTLPWGGWARPAIVAGELVLGVSNPWGDSGGPSLVRCDLAGHSCTKTDLDLGRFWTGPSAHVAPLAHDTVRDAFLVGTALFVDDGIPPYELAPLVLRKPRAGGVHTVHDVSAGPGENRYVGQRLTPDGSYVDEVNRKIYALGFTDHVGLTSTRKIRRPLSRCDLDGTGCTVVETGTAEHILGVAGGGLYMLGVWRGDPRENDDTSVTELLRCSVDGTACSRTHVQRPMHDRFSTTPLATLDRERGAALVVLPGAGSSEQSLHRCPLDGSPCSSPTALPASSAAAIAVDTHRDKLLVAADTSSVVRCNLDGTGCVLHDIAGGAEGGWRSPKILVDVEGVHLVTAAGAFSGTGDSAGIAVFRCAPDMTGCTRRDLGLGAGAHGIRTFSAGSSADELLVATEDTYRLRKTTAYRCQRDGAGCLEIDMSAGQPPMSGARPTVLVDPVARRLLVVTSNEALLMRPSLFSVGL